MLNNLRKTKIIATIGPASSKEDVLQKMALSGMDIARLNLSHGQAEEHRMRFSLIKRVAKRINKPIGILGDLEGYRIRTGPLRGHKEINLEESSVLELTARDILGNEEQIGVSYKNFPKYVKRNDTIFLDDGNLELKVLGVSKDTIKARVIMGGSLGEHKGLLIPGAKFRFPSITKKDLNDIHFCIKLGLDYVAQSFVRSPKDILTIKAILKKENASHILVVAKIENPLAIQNLEKIVAVSDAIMIARGDMGVCLPRSEVPLIQKRIINMCNRKGVPVITATQMLESMVTNHHPTRAEVADVANAIIDGSDCLMLSAETAKGNYPAESVKEMEKICLSTEASLEYETILQERKIYSRGSISDSLGLSVRQLSELIKAQHILAFTLSAETARNIWRYRPRANIIAVTPYPKVARQLLLYWGLRATVAKKVKNVEGYFRRFLDKAIDLRLVNRGNLIVATSGIAGKQKPTGLIKVLKA